MVKTNSSRRRELFSDPEVAPGKQHSAQEPKGWKWVLGYRSHVAVCTRYGVPLAQIVTLGNESDMNYLKPLVEKLRWRPEVVIADRGYDSKYHSERLHRRDSTPVIHKTRPPRGFHTRGRGRKYYSTRGTPLCECMSTRPFIGIYPGTGERVYRPVRGCKRSDQLKGFSKGDFEVWLNPEDDLSCQVF